MEGTRGGRVLSFQEKRKNQRKADWLFSRMAYLVQALLEGYIREATPLSCDACFAQSQRRLLLALFAAHASYSLYSFRDSANGVLLFRQVSPAPCSPPLGGSDEISAVRFTAAVKYGGRENKPPRREAGCMSGHPCRAHHKLKWARKKQSVLVLLYSRFPRSESSKTIIAAKFRCPLTLRRLPKLQRVNPV